VVPPPLRLTRFGDCQPVEARSGIFRQAAIAICGGFAEDLAMPESPIKRYALVPQSGEDGVRRFHLARVAGASGSLPAAARLERMEEIAALERRDNGQEPRRDERA
jgi:hypothetical protein